jgi:Ca-activated chloride channel homolog
MESSTWPWYSWRWFWPFEQFEQYQWEQPLWLHGLWIIPAIFVLRWLVLLQIRQKLPIALTKRDLRTDPISYLRFLPPLLLMISLALITVALARPQSTNEQVEQWSEGIDIVMAIDISQSMEIEDFKPNRMEAAKEVAIDFVNGRFQDRIGLVIFSGDAYSRTPLTTDYELLNNYIRDISFDMIESRGTAIGSALAVSTNRLRESDAKSKVIILLSDGDNTAGNIDPLTAAKLAYAYGIRIYTILIGKEGKVPYGKDYWGNPRYVDNSVDETTLREIASIGKGNFYRALDKATLQRVFDEIDLLEKVEIKETRFKDTTDYYTVYLRWAIVFLLAWLLLRSTFVSNALVD